MGRVIRRMLAIVVVGAAMTLALAWGLPLLPWQWELWRSPRVTSNVSYAIWVYTGNPLTSGQQRWLEDIGLQPLVPTRPMVYPMRSRTIWGAGWSRTEIIECQQFELAGVVSHYVTTGPAPTAAVITSAGWPLGCLACIQWRERAAPAYDSWTPEWRLRGGFRIGSPNAIPTYTNGVADPPPVLPFTVSPGALAIDIMINGAIAAGLFAFAGFMRRRVLGAIRTRRGQCPACGYPRGTAAMCSECGAMLASAAGT